jgi:hypothetical protein
MYMKAGKVDACGIRVLGVTINADLATGLGVDGSINIYASGLSAVKGLSYDVKVGALKAGAKPRGVPLESFWFKAPGQDATHPIDGKFHDGEDIGSKLYVAKAETILEIYKAIIDGQALTIGVKRTQERSERIYFGRVKMSEEEHRQAITCLAELLR